MGRIKSKLTKRTARQLLHECPEIFSKEFDTNKSVLGNTLPSKRLRNQVAGYITRIKKNDKKIIDDVENDKSK